MLKKIVLIGNFKQNPPKILDAHKILTEYVKLKKTQKNILFGAAVPNVFLNDLNKKFGKSIPIYSQAVSSFSGGAHTGENSAGQINSIGIKNTIIGHSERRAMGESDIDIQNQVTQALAQKMNIVLCVGEKERHEDSGHIRIVNEQIETALKFVKKTQMKSIIIAYEPVWAIGVNALRGANENEIYEMAITIKKKLSEIFGKVTGANVPIIYGGSVNSKNCISVMSVHHIDGLLLGRTSLEPKELSKIIGLINNK